MDFRPRSVRLATSRVRARADHVGALGDLALQDGRVVLGLGNPAVRGTVAVGWWLPK